MPDDMKAVVERPYEVEDDHLPLGAALELLATATDMAVYGGEGSADVAWVARQCLSERRKMVEALEKIAASGPAAKPDGPDYDCGNSGDIAWEATQLAEWHLAQIARAALTGSREQ